MRLQTIVIRILEPPTVSALASALPLGSTMSCRRGHSGLLAVSHVWLPKSGNSDRQARDRKHGERVGFHHHPQVVSSYSVIVEVPGRRRPAVPVVGALPEEIAGWHLGGGPAVPPWPSDRPGPTLFERRTSSVVSTGKEGLDERCGGGCDRHARRNP